MTEKFALKITSAVVIDGKIKTKGSIVYAPEQLAEQLMNRGKAVVATAEDADAPADDDGAGRMAVLYGSSILPALIQIGDAEVQLGTVVGAAHVASGLSAEDWNALPEADREQRLADQVKAMQDKAEADKAAADAAAKAAAEKAAKAEAKAAAKAAAKK